MKEYGYGALMSDYVYLEDVGRKVKEWGRDIGKGKYQVTEHDRVDRKSTRLNSSHPVSSRMPSSA